MEPRAMVHPHVKTITIFTNDGFPASTCLIDLPRANVPYGWRTAWISDVWTAEEFRGRGYAGLVIKAGVELASTAGADDILLATSLPEPRRNLYASNGFKYLHGSTFLMGKALTRVEAGPFRRTVKLRVWLDDLGIVSSIVARPHYSMSQGRIAQSSAVDAEEIMSTLIGQNRDLGYVLITREDTADAAIAGWVHRGEEGKLHYRFDIRPEPIGSEKAHLILSARGFSAALDEMAKKDSFEGYGEPSEWCYRTRDA